MHNQTSAAVVAMSTALTFVCLAVHGEPLDGALGQALDARQGAVVADVAEVGRLQRRQWSWRVGYYGEVAYSGARVVFHDENR